MPRLPRLSSPQVVVVAICVGIGLAIAIANVRSWELEDAQAYWNAGMRLRDGGALYVAVDPNADEMLAYRYAPWFAWLWVPLTYLPKPLVELVWSAILILASGLAVLPILRRRSVAAICLVALLGGLLLRTASTGNVHALMMAGLMWGLPRRSGPLWIGVAASLKLVPILFVLPYLGQRRPLRALLAILVAAVLTAPALLYDLSAYPSEAGESISLLSNVGPIAFAVVALLSFLGGLVYARTRYAWLAAAVSVLACLPRLELYSLTYLGVGAISSRSNVDDQSEYQAR
jgi:hypothetical protein